MPSKREVLDSEDARWQDLGARLARLDGDAWERPLDNGWTPKDILTHIAVWHANTTDRLEALRSTGEIPPVPDVDAFNEEQLQQCRALSLHDARVMFEASRHRFREELSILDEDLSDRLAAIIAGNGHGHYDEHIAQLDRLLEGS